MIAIVDYGAGNVKSVSKALEKIGLEAQVTADRKVIDNSRAVLLPGVGAFGKAMENLEKLDLISCIQRNVKSGKYFLGICLGMQMLFDKSYEDGVWQGFGFLGGEIRRFETALKVPHMGWNQLIQDRADAIAKGIEPGEYAYFVHSYYAVVKDPADIIFHTEYDVPVPAVVGRDNVLGMQFHPEKSSKSGIRLLKNFGELIK